MSDWRKLLPPSEPQQEGFLGLGKRNTHPENCEQCHGTGFVNLGKIDGSKVDRYARCAVPHKEDTE